jgi:hypothetical protein
LGSGEWGMGSGEYCEIGMLVKLFILYPENRIIGRVVS